MEHYGWAVVAFGYVLLGVLVVALVNPLPGGGFAASQRRLFAVPLLAVLWPVFVALWLLVWRPQQLASKNSESAVWKAIAKHKKSDPHD